MNCYGPSGGSSVLPIMDALISCRYRSVGIGAESSSVLNTDVVEERRMFTSGDRVHLRSSLHDHLHCVVHCVNERRSATLGILLVREHNGCRTAPLSVTVTAMYTIKQEPDAHGSSYLLPILSPSTPCQTRA
jgi:hypothetical protein